MSEPRERLMYMLTRNGLPVVVQWGRNRKPFYYLVGQTVLPLRLYKTLRGVKWHVTKAQQAISPARTDVSYGYVIVLVPNG